MKNDLVKERSERLGRSGPEVEKALSAFAAAVNDRLQSDGEANLAGLGTLRKIGESYTFDPSDALAQAVNYRWMAPDGPVAAASDGGPGSAGPALTGPEDKPLRKAKWAPIDPTDVGAPARDTPSPAAPPRKPSAPVPAAPDRSHGSPAPAAGAARTQSPPKAPVPAPAPPPTSGIPPVHPTEVYDPVAPLVEDLTFETLHQTLAAAEQEDSPTKAPAASPADPPSSARPPRRRSATARAQPAGNRNLLIVAAAVVILLVAAVAWMQLGGSADPGDPEDPAVTENQTTPPATDSGEGTTGAESENTGETDGATEGGTETEGGGETESPEPAPAPSGDLDLNSDGYTLIVGSTTDLAAAQRSLDRFRSMGQPVGILSYPDGTGQMRHRIAVGEFSTSDAAGQARETLNNLPQDTWVTRIRR